MSQQSMIDRYTSGERILHWVTAITFFLLAASGLAFFHPSMFWLTGLLGGGTWARILHPFIGVVMFVAFILMAVKFWHHNVLSGNDRKWLGQIGDVIANRDDRVPPIGRYNPGQKILFWVLLASMIVLLVSGIAIWQPYFAPSFSIGTIRFGALMHALGALALILLIIVHVYSSFWVKGSTEGMLSGKVSRAWAKAHHPKWYEEVARK
jgi:formate dehydrogenase subunit gamma